MTSIEIILTSAQTKAARALLGWSQRDLAGHARLAVSTVADFERGHRAPASASLEAIAQAMTAAGVYLAEGGAVTGALPSHSSSAPVTGQPIRWIDATDLSQWGERRDGQDGVPELLSRLIYAGFGQAARLRFPSGDSVLFAGWDGICEVDAGSAHVPAGRSAWEVGTQREKIRDKATREITKRSGMLPASERAATTFVFVTTRRWPGKGDWVREQRSTGRWHDVRAIDGDDLVNWIELHPAVGYWLAVRIAKRPPGLQTLGEAWEEWTLSTRPPMSAELVLAGRDEEAARLLRWLRAPASTFSLQAEAAGEAVAFLHSAIGELPQEHRRPYLARVLVATLPDAARALGDGPSPLIIVVPGGDAGLAERLAARGHHVFAAFGSEAGNPEALVRLPRPRRPAIAAALRGMGMSHPDAERFARDSGRSLAVLRRLLPAAAGFAAPQWARQPTARQIIPAMLAGAWLEGNPTDCRLLGRLAGMDYAEVAAALAPWSTALDSPLRKVGDAWKVGSPRDAWFRLAPHVTSGDLDAFVDVAFEVLAAGEADYGSPDEATGEPSPIAPAPSQLLCAGVAENVVILAIHGPQARGVPNSAMRIDALVRRLLDGADGQRWRGLSDRLQNLAEAAPETFLSAVEDALALDAPPVLALFEHHGSAHSALLWALETLAWEPTYFARAAWALAALARLDPGGRLANRPRESLRGLFLLWCPQTGTPQRERLRVLKLLRRREPKSAWELMHGLVPRGHDSVSSAPHSRWRDFSAEPGETITPGLMHEGARTITDWLLEDAGSSPERWLDVIDVMPNIDPDKRAEALHQLARVAGSMDDAASRGDIRTALRKLLHHHRAFPDADWSLPEAELAPMEAVYDLLAPGDIVEEFGWLFDCALPPLLDPSPEHDFEADQARAADRQREALLRIFEAVGADGVLRLLGSTSHPYLLGNRLGQVAMPFAAKQAMAERLLRDLDAKGADFAGGLIAGMGTEMDKLRAALIGRARRGRWPSGAVVRLLLAIGSRRDTWEQARRFGPEVDAAYWAQVSPFFSGQDDPADTAHAVRRLLGVGRARAALSLVGYAPSHFDADVLADVLLAAASDAVPEGGSSNDHTMFAWHVQQALVRLDEVGIEDERLARIELAHLRMLNLSRHYPQGRPPKAIYRLLAAHPDLFVDVLCMLYRPAEGSGVVEEHDVSGPARTARANRAWELLHHMDHLPGSRRGGIDGRELEAWVAEVRRLCAKVGRTPIGDYRVGQLLAHAPAEDDGTWPHAAVREVIEVSRSRDLEAGIAAGRLNARGPTIRGLEDGGEQERGLVAQYDIWSRETAFEWPRTSALLARLAQSYEADGRWYDDQRDADDWRY